ncbi:hypothetical protein N7486_010551 [Penicillium sp. IBT 16267x]|nr:hypothetical protein N7486_010551 [Penicillium sp. IBT 16267x]
MSTPTRSRVATGCQRCRVRFHDETPEIINLYLSSLEDGHDRWIQNTEKSPTPEERNIHTPEFSPHTQQQHINHVSSHVSHDPIDVSPSSVSLYSTPTSRTSSKPFQPFTEREAILVRNFVENMALWADITDPHRHFEIDVPTRAFKEPVLRYAIFAFSSRHLNRQTDDAAEALQYHNLCVQILIPALSDPEQHITEDILAAVAILRQHEEMDGEDNQFHLTGTTHILNTVSTFGSSGGLGEAASWLCLRQEIYVSLTTQQPLLTNLENFYDSNIFQRDDDFAWSSKIVFLLAKVLQSAFSDSSMVNTINEEVESWFTLKPLTFEPVRLVPRGSESDRRFPTIWMLLPVHVIGLQYYHIAKIIVTLSERPLPSSTYDSLRHSRKTEKNVRYHLLTILGLAQSNPRAENTLFTARHSLVAWGWVLRHRSDQEAAEALLHDMHARTGWNMDGLVQSLRQQWQDEDGSRNLLSPLDPNNISMTVNTTPSKLRVAIIGGGIAGLAAAGFLRKHPQYIVTVYELRSEDWQESSAALGHQTNGSSIVEQLGITREEIRADTGSGYRTYNIREEQMSKGRVAVRPGGETGFRFVHRQDLKDALLRRVTGIEGEGEPIQVVYDSHIVEIEPELGILKFADRPSIEADLIIGADGIHSKVREAVIPSSHPQPSLCGLCVYRFVVPMDVLRDVNGKLPNILTLDEGNFVVIIAAGDEGNRNIVIYPCRELQLMNFVCGVPDTSPRVLAQLKSTGSHESLVNDMIEEFQGFPDWILQLFSRTTLIEPFPVIDQEPLPTYVKGRTMLIGDAAHAMAPYQHRQPIKLLRMLKVSTRYSRMLLAVIAFQIF